MHCVLFDKVRNEGLKRDRTAVKKEHSIVEFYLCIFYRLKISSLCIFLGE